MRHHNHYLLVVCIIVSLSCNTHADENISGDSLPAVPVQIRLESSGSGSGFFLETDPSDGADPCVHLVTARHVLFSTNGLLKSPNATVLWHSSTNQDATGSAELDLKALLKRGYIKHCVSNDIAVVEIGRQKYDEAGHNCITYNTRMITCRGAPVSHFNTGQTLGYQRVALAHDIFMFGYPDNVNMYHQIDPDKPMIAKGVVAQKNDKKRTILVYCPAYGGNSGGPVIEVVTRPPHVRLPTWYPIIGIVTQFVPYNIKKMDGQRIPLIGHSNYAVVQPMDTILDLIGNAD